MASNDHHTSPQGPSPPTDGLEDILAKSCQLMATRGYDGTSIRDLAQATDRSLSGLYHYFRSKDELLFLINFHGFTRLNAAWDRISDVLTDPDERLFGFVYFHLTYFVQHMDEMRVMTWGTRELEPDKAEAIQRLKDHYADQARSILMHNLAARDWCEADEKRVERQMYLLFGMMNWIFGWFTPRKHGALTGLINDVYTTCTHGFGGGGRSAELAVMHDKLAALYAKAMAHGAWDRSRILDNIANGSTREKGGRLS